MSDPTHDEALKEWYREEVKRLESLLSDSQKEVERLTTLSGQDVKANKHLLDSLTRLRQEVETWKAEANRLNPITIQDRISRLEESLVLTHVENFNLCHRNNEMDETILTLRHSLSEAREAIEKIKTFVESDLKDMEYPSFSTRMAFESIREVVLKLERSTEKGEGG
jgi:hypothetical protein